MFFLDQRFILYKTFYIKLSFLDSRSCGVITLSLQNTFYHANASLNTKTKLGKYIENLSFIYNTIKKIHVYRTHAHRKCWKIIFYASMCAESGIKKCGGNLQTCLQVYFYKTKKNIAFIYFFGFFILQTLLTSYIFLL